MGGNHVVSTSDFVRFDRGFQLVLLFDEVHVEVANLPVKDEHPLSGRRTSGTRVVYERARFVERCAIGVTL